MNEDEKDTNETDEAPESPPSVVLSGEGFLGVAPTPKIKRAYWAAEAEPVQEVKLGRRRPKELPLVPPFALYLSAERMTAAPPAKVDYYTKAKKSLDRMYQNDRYGCCVVTGKYHGVGIASANDQPGEAVLGTDEEVLQMYRTICGPGDQGCIVTDVLNWERDKGLPFNGKLRKIDGYVRGNPRNKLEVQVGTYLFAAPTIAFMLPADWPGKAVWDVSTAKIVGGHDVTICGYDDVGVQLSSWGRVYTMTWAALTSGKYVEELYYVLYPEWYGDDRLSPLGIDITRLKSDLAKLGKGQLPDTDPTPQPPPGPNPPPTPPAPGSSTRVAASLWLDFPSTRPGTIGKVIGSAKVVGPVPAAPTDGQDAPLELDLSGIDLPDSVTTGLDGDGVAADRYNLPLPLMLLIAEYGMKVVPVILAGIADRKPIRDIVREVLTSVLR